jgi:dienelactone hydrolase
MKRATLIAILCGAVLGAAGACSGGGGGGADIDAAASPIDGAPGDGGSPDAAQPPIDAPPAAGDPGMPGSWQVNTQDNVMITLANGSVRGTVFSPSMGGATPAAGPFPLVIVSSGFQIARTQYAPYCQHLASWGYVCVTHDYAASGNHQAKAREVAQTIDWALGASSGLAARIAGQPIAVAGHSLGGKVSINAAAIDSRIKAVVGWDPVDALPPFGNDGSQSVTPEMMGNVRVPIALLGELGDSMGGLGGMACAPAADNYQQYFQAACQAPARLEVTIAMADHVDWVANRGSCGIACIACNNGQTPDATVQLITKRVTTAWLQRHLRSDASVAPWLGAQVGMPTTVRTTAPGC